MNYLHALILGFVEGVSEFLPISSTGHLILAGKLLALPQTEFIKSFDIVIQLGAILAVVVLYGRSLTLNPKIWKRVLAAFLPTAVIGFVLYKLIKRFLLGDYRIVLAALFLGGIFLIIFEKIYKADGKKIASVEEIPFLKAFWIGVIQALSVIPGVSRSAATIIGGLSLGVERKTIVEFSFLLAVPTMAAASALDLLKSASSFNSADFGLLAVGFMVSFFVALACIRWFLKYVQHHTFIFFGVYRILIVIVWVLFLR